MKQMTPRQKKEAKKLLTISIAVMMITIIFSQLINNDTETLDSGPDTDGDGIPDVLECGNKDDIWLMADGDSSGCRNQDTYVPYLEIGGVKTENSLWEFKTTGENINTLPLFYNDGVIIGTFNEVEKKTTIYYFSENTGYEKWRYVIIEAKVLDILVDETTKSLIIFYDDLCFPDSDTKIIILDIENYPDEENLFY